ncbi:MAG: hypothetical protein ACMG55_00900 [Microcoleus sp.]
MSPDSGDRTSGGAGSLEPFVTSISSRDRQKTRVVRCVMGAIVLST